MNTSVLRTRRRTAALVAAWATVGVVGAASLTGVAMAADSNPAPTSTAQAAVGGQGTAAGAGQGTAGRAGLARLKQLGKRVLHGEFVVQGKDGARTVDTQLGLITAVTSTSVAVKSSDGYTQTWTLASTTKVRGDKRAGSVADLTVGATVRLLGPKDGSTATLALAVLRPAATTS